MCNNILLNSRLLAWPRPARRLILKCSGTVTQSRRFSDQSLTNAPYTSSVLSKRIGLPSVRHGLPLFLTIVVGLAIWQVRLTWLLMEQDRNLAPKRLHDRLELVANMAVPQIAVALDNWTHKVRNPESLPPNDSAMADLPPGATFVLFTGDSITLYPTGSLLFVPNPPPPSTSVAERLKVADREINEPRYYSKGNPCSTCDQAIQALLPLAAQAGKRAEVLLRIARLEQKMSRSEAALATYQQLSAESGVSSSGAPYALIAAAESLDTLTDRRRAASQAASIRSALLEGRWRLSREVFDYYWAEVNRLRQIREDPPAPLMALASLVSSLYREWNDERHHGMMVVDYQAFGMLGSNNWHSSGSSWGRAFEIGTGSILLWYGTLSHFTAMLSPAAALNLKLPATESDVRWRVAFLMEPKAASSEFGANPHVLKSLAEPVGIPGFLDLWSVEPESKGELNRTIWLAGVLLMLGLVLGGAYAMHRGLNKEFRVAQLQSDFVSAVSHEFRSPLTTLSTLTELLVENRMPDEIRRRQSYVFLDRETARLRRLVDDLLDFGRMESGRKPYLLAPHPLFALVRSAVADFREDTLGSGFGVEINLEERPAVVNADAGALKRAIRNLLENAMKYSPECRTIWVDGAVRGHQAMISVRDHGMGIEPQERHEIFQKFVRGAAAKQAGIKGTGIGLAMVRQIVEAMGGEIRLESRKGEGSAFIILLPLVNIGKTKV